MDAWLELCTGQFVEPIKRDVEVITSVTVYCKRESARHGPARSCSAQMLSGFLSVVMK